MLQLAFRIQLSHCRLLPDPPPRSVGDAARGGGHAGAADLRPRPRGVRRLLPAGGTGAHRWWGLVWGGRVWQWAVGLERSAGRGAVRGTPGQRRALAGLVVGGRGEGEMV
jgi:hypothetical protein